MLPGARPRDEPAAAPSFPFSVGAAYRVGPDVMAVRAASLETFFDGALAPPQRLSSPLPVPSCVVHDDCGVADAFHDTAAGTIALCAELVECSRDLRRSRAPCCLGGAPRGERERAFVEGRRLLDCRASFDGTTGTGRARSGVVRAKRAATTSPSPPAEASLLGIGALECPHGKNVGLQG